MPPVISIVGFHDSGKTTIVEQVIRRLTTRGLRVGTVKHSGHGFTIDRPGKDSWRHRAAGATTVVISGDKSHALISKAPATLPELLRYFDSVDVVLTEGYKSAGKPKLEVYNRAIREAGEPLLALQDPTIWAVITDELQGTRRALADSRPDVVVFHRDDHEGIVKFILERLLSPMRSLVGVILAGGQSTRMGQNKAFIRLGGETLVQRQARRLRQTVKEVIIVTRSPEEFSDIDARCVIDSELGQGPLAGLHAGINAAGGHPCFVVAVDMPFVNMDLATHEGLLLAGPPEFDSPTWDVVVPRFQGRHQPLHAVYGPGCLAPIESIFSQHSQPALHALFDVSRVKVLDERVIRRFGDPDIFFFNANTPEQLDHARTLLADQGGHR